MATTCCSVCTDAFNKSTRRVAACCYCNYAACMACIKRYLTTTTEDPHCMSCRRGWNAEFLDSIVTRAFRTVDLRKHREGVLMDRERSMLPATTVYVEAELRNRRYDLRILQLQQEMRALQVRMAHMGFRRRIVMAMDPNDVPPQYDDVDGPDDVGGEAAPKRSVAAFIKPCPTEGCRGFLSTAYKCGVCSTRLCPTCHEVTVPPAREKKEKEKEKENEEEAPAHVCNPDSVASVRAIASDSKACPKCGVMIFRVSGCDQMYCTVPGCCTAFSFRTGAAVTGHVHNPHYYEFLRNNGAAVPREPGDPDPAIPCEGVPHVHVLLRVLRRDQELVLVLTPEQNGMRQTLHNVHMFALHVQEVELRRYGAPAVAPDALNRDLRVKFMQQQIQEEEFKRTNFLREKRRLFNVDVHQVLSMMAAVMGDELRALLSEFSFAAADATMRTLNKLRDYSNVHLRAIGKRYHYSVPVISMKSWVMDKASA